MVKLFAFQIIDGLPSTPGQPPALQVQELSGDRTEGPFASEQDIGLHRSVSGKWLSWWNSASATVFSLPPAALPLADPIGKKEHLGPSFVRVGGQQSHNVGMFELPRLGDEA